MVGGVGCPLARVVLAMLLLNLSPTPGVLAVWGQERLDIVQELFSSSWNTVLATDLKHSLLWAALKKLIQPWPS